MPLCTQIIREGEPLSLPNGWGWWHVVCISLTSQYQETTDPTQHDRPVFESPLGQSRTGEVIVEWPLSFRDPSDGEVLTLHTGDRLLMWRE